MTPMNPQDLDAVYSGLCKTMTRLGEANAPLFLARLALLAIERLGDAELARQLVAAAAEDLTPAEAA